MQSIGAILRPRWRDFRAVPKRGDWYDEDGTLRCGNCGQPKECVVDRWAIPGMDRDEPRYLTLACACECEGARAEADPGREGRLNRLRAECYDIPGLSGVTFAQDDGRSPEAVSAVREYLVSFGPDSPGLYLHGRGGTGKTWAAAALVNELLSRGVRCAFSSLPLLASGMDYQGAVARLASCSLVVLDDVGAERGTDTMREGSTVIVDALYAKGTRIVATSNATLGAMEEADPRLGRRLSDRCIPIDFG